MGDTIILESIKTPQTFVHCNHDNVTPGATREVNISATPSRFQIVPVAKFRDLASSGTTVRGGDFLQVRFYEELACLMMLISRFSVLAC